MAHDGATSDTSGPEGLAAAFGKHQLSLASRAVHADDYINTHRAVAPAVHLSTTFRYSDNPDELRQWSNVDPNAPFDSHIYSRDSAPNSTRFEAILSNILGGPTLTYASGLSAFHAMIVLLNPRRVAIGGGYHGCHGVLGLLGKLSGVEKIELDDGGDADANDARLLATLKPGDVIHVETPLNPTGEARNVARYAEIAHVLGCYLTIDATFAPPPLFDPFAWNADVVMHSGSKYFGGHSDLLCGSLTVNPRHVPSWSGSALASASASASSTSSSKSPLAPKPVPATATGATDWIQALRDERLVLGSVMGNLESWLGVRSLRTLELRVLRQSASAERVVAWLAAEQKRAGSVVSRLVVDVRHASLQPEAADASSWLRQQLPRGYGPVFSIVLRSSELAKRLPSKLHLFHHATSLGGVESLIEWRAITDKTVDTRLLRVSIGVEAWEDIQADLQCAFEALLVEEAGAAWAKTA